MDAQINREPLQNWDFELLVQTVAAQRGGNPRFGLTTDLTSIRNEVDFYNARRMQQMQGASHFIIDGAGGPDPTSFPVPQHRRALGVVAGVKQAALGAVILKDWLGEGGVPVANEQAEARAAVCAVCPQNAAGDWTTFFTGPVAAALRRQLSVRADLNLTTTSDAKLNVCSACGCPLKLKVHVPLKHVTDHLDAEVGAKLDPACWILHEMNPTP